MLTAELAMIRRSGDLPGVALWFNHLALSARTFLPVGLSNLEIRVRVRRPRCLWTIRPPLTVSVTDRHGSGVLSNWTPQAPLRPPPVTAIITAVILAPAPVWSGFNRKRAALRPSVTRCDLCKTPHQPIVNQHTS